MKKLTLTVTVLLISLMSITLVACGRTVLTSDEGRYTIITRGRWDGNVYINEYLGLRFNLPNEWISASDDDIAMLAGISLDISGLDQELPDDFWEIAGISMLWDMWAMDMTTGSNVQIIYEALPYPQSMMSELEFVETILAQVKQAPIDISANIVHGTTVIGNYAWYSYASVVDMHGNQEHMRHFINIKNDIARHIIIVYLPDISPLEVTLGLLGDI